MKKEELRIVFMGTPEFAVPSLAALVEGGYNVVAVVTQPDRPVGRHGSVLQPSAVKRYALDHQLLVLQPEKMRDEAFQAELKSFGADLQVVVAFRMLPESVWAMPRFGTFNVHAALLPQYRGAAPINWAIINGEKETGVTTFFLDHDIDTGRIILQKRLAIGPEDNVETVYDRLMALGAEICTETVDLVIGGDGQVESADQSGIADRMTAEGQTLHNAPKLFKENCRIDFSKSAQQVHDFIRGLSPIPGAWCEMVDDKGVAKILKIYESRVVEPNASADGKASQVVSSASQASGNNPSQASPVGKSQASVGNFSSESVESPLRIPLDSRLEIACGDGRLLRLTQLQLEGKKRMDGASFKNGIRSFENFYLK